jgi:hypothetical protein
MANGERETISRKYQVFISSTFRDLQPHRQEAMLGIVKAGHLPVALEHYPPQSGDKRSVIQQAIESSHFYVLILGHRYGSRTEAPDGPSYVEMELDWAEKSGLKILAFVLDGEEAEKKRNKLRRPRDRVEIENEAAYQRFRDRLSGFDDYFYKPFSKASDIYPELYAYFSRSHAVPGLIPEPKDTPVSDYLQVYVQNEIVRDIVERLGQFGKVESRLAMATRRKKAMALAFDQIHGDDIEKKFSKVFIESGSTVLYIAKQLAPRLPTKAPGGDRGPSPTVLTNNALAYAYLWMCKNVMCHPEPEGPPDDKYGGMYGPLTHRDRSPDYPMPALDIYDRESAKLIEGMSRKILGKPEEDAKPLILGAASGLQLTDAITAVDYENGNQICGESKLMETICTCRGLHVGSYRNMLFKRCLYLTEAPTIIFIHDDKIDSKIEVGKCHFIFDEKFTWASFVRDHPLSLWIACTQESADGVLEKCRSSLLAGGWKFSKYAAQSENPILIGHNERFRVACEQAKVNPYSNERL